MFDPISTGIGIGGSILGGLIGGGGEGDQLTAKAYANWQGLPTGYTPELYQYISENAPQFFNLPEDVQAQIISEDPTLRGMQTSSLNNMQQIAEKGYTTQQEKAYSDAQKKANQLAQGQNQALASQFQQQGRGGAGIQAALQQMAQQAAQDRAAEAMTAQAADEAAARQQANKDMLSMAGNVRSQDYTKNSANANIINQFNLENSRRQNEVRNANTNLQNQTNQRNIEAQRNTSNQNTAAANLEKQQNLQNLYTKNAGATNQLGNMANRADAGNAAWGQTVKDIASGVAQGIGSSNNQSSGVGYMPVGQNMFSGSYDDYLKKNPLG